MILFNKKICEFKRSGNNKGFTLVELLVVISIISLLLAILIPSLVRARQQAQSVICMNNIKQLGLAFIMYAQNNNDYAMPAAIDKIYWWGGKKSDGIDHKLGFVWPYLKSELSNGSVFQCPSQPFGSYKLQGAPKNEKNNPKWMTSTYGYNGYYLCPPVSGWQDLPGPWQKLANVSTPATVIAFADALIDFDNTGKNIENNFSLEPPYIFDTKSRRGNPWKVNMSPTTCFRHNEKTNAIFVDIHSESVTSKGAKYTSPNVKIGSIGAENAPYYVPNYLDWPMSDRMR